MLRVQLQGLRFGFLGLGLRVLGLPILGVVMGLILGVLLLPFAPGPLTIIWTCGPCSEALMYNSPSTQVPLLLYWYTCEAETLHNSQQAMQEHVDRRMLYGKLRGYNKMFGLMDGQTCGLSS